MPTYRLDLAYDGWGYSGYAIQPGQRTVQGELEAALAKVLGAQRTAVAGRTDAGVHAAGQVVSFECVERVDSAGLHRALNAMLNPEVVVRQVAEAPAGFNARFSAVGRTYRYFVLNRWLPEPLLRHTSWHVAQPLQLDAMREAAAQVVGEHDFTSFCRARIGSSCVKRVTLADWHQTDDNLLWFEIRANSFCHQMVRSLVAVLVQVGKGNLGSGELAGMLAARDRSVGKGVAPPRGLILWQVHYPDQIGESHAEPIQSHFPQAIREGFDA